MHSELRGQGDAHFLVTAEALGEHMRACRLRLLNLALKPVDSPYRGVRGTDFTSTYISFARLHAADANDWQMHAHIRH